MLVATDVAARGIHVDDISLVLQVDPPKTNKDYLHRARTRLPAPVKRGAVVQRSFCRYQGANRCAGSWVRPGSRPEPVEVVPGSDELAGLDGLPVPAWGLP